MINHPAFRVEPWCLRATAFDLAVLAQTESLFALVQRAHRVRGNLDEGEPHGLPGTYLNGVYELRPLPYAEAGYGYPESGQTLINVTERQADPAPGRRRAVRRPLRASCAARARASTSVPAYCSARRNGSRRRAGRSG